MYSHKPNKWKGKHVYYVIERSKLTKSLKIQKLLKKIQNTKLLDEMAEESGTLPSIFLSLENTPRITSRKKRRFTLELYYIYGGRERFVS